MTRIAYVDESQRKGFYAIAAIALSHGSVTTARRRLLELAPRAGVARRHFTRESPAAKQKMLGVFRQLPGATYVCVTTARSDVIDQRASALTAIVRALVADGLDRLVLDNVNNAQQHRDRQTMWRALGRSTPITFSHEVPHSREPMLWVPDAVAWCAGRVDDWRTALDGWVTVVVPEKCGSPR